MSMTETVLPSFLRFREEGLIIGRILAGYGELEFEMCDCVFAINNDLDSSIRQLFGRRGELRRIKIAEELMKAQYEAAGLAAPHRAIMEDMDWCRQVRNQYAHCNWYDRENEGLCFIDLEATAKRTITNATSLIERRHRIDVPLLTEQEAFFKYVQRGFWYLAASYREWAGGTPNHAFGLPQKVPQPRKHN
ncbi:MAG TPA: hypothetical protein VF913_21405 [Xanthobacteraceae bacterium]